MFRNPAVSLIILIGLVSLFADMTYEGARSIHGQYLQFLGASATVVGFVAGFGELLGYSIRLVSGYIADKTKQYWTVAILGYFINLVAVPLLALAGNWQVAIMLMLLERIGKGIRAPVKDTILSYASKEIGRGFGFGLQETIDQIGAIIGPLIVSLVLLFKGGYQNCYLVLLIPAILAMIFLSFTSCKYPNPHIFEKRDDTKAINKLPKAFWFYIVACGLIAAGFADFPIIAYHFKKVSIIDEKLIPVLFSLAMFTDAVCSIPLGKLFDRFGVTSLIFVIFISSFFAPFTFLGNTYLVLFGIVLWGIGIGAQESIMRACISEITHVDKRGIAYGIFSALFGLFWFMGSALMGFLYDLSVNYLVIFSVCIQLASMPLFLLVKKYTN